jgi:ribulose-phosphate 3-epimerase
MCANLGRLEEDFRTLERAGCEELHFDIMDGLFVPNITLGADFVRMAKRVCSLPCDVHLMISKPDDYVAQFIDAGADSVSIHVETCPHSQRVLTQIRTLGASPGIAVNPATPLTKLEYLLPFVDRVMMMTVDPGYAGQIIIASAFERVKILRENLTYQKRPVSIQVDGNINVQNAARLLAMGADNLVLGTASIFTEGDLGENLRTFRKKVEIERQVV